MRVPYPSNLITSKSTSAAGAQTNSGGITVPTGSSYLLVKVYQQASNFALPETASYGGTDLILLGSQATGSVVKATVYGLPNPTPGGNTTLTMKWAVSARSLWYAEPWFNVDSNNPTGSTFLASGTAQTAVSNRASGSVGGTVTDAVCYNNGDTVNITVGPGQSEVAPHFAGNLSIGGASSYGSGSSTVVTNMRWTIASNQTWVSVAIPLNGLPNLPVVLTKGKITGGKIHADSP
jgi:hypothetical protein